jgi:hypothetical protein
MLRSGTVSPSKPEPRAPDRAPVPEALRERAGDRRTLVGISGR